MLSIDAGDESGRRHALIDRPDYPISDVLDALDRAGRLPANRREAAMQELMKGPPSPQQRLTLGRSGDRSVGLRLKDVEGRDRVVISVASDGTPAIQLLDETGKVTGQLTPRDKR